MTRSMDFHLTERGTSIRTEILGGVTTFVSMAYIIVVNPAILAAAGLPAGPSTVATILVAVVGTLLMGPLREASHRRRAVHGRERLHRLRPRRARRELAAAPRRRGRHRH